MLTGIRKFFSFWASESSVTSVTYSQLQKYTLEKLGTRIGYCSILTGAYDLASEINYFLDNQYPGYFCIEHHQWNNRKESTIKNLNELKSIICKF